MFTRSSSPQKWFFSFKTTALIAGLLIVFLAVSYILAGSDSLYILLLSALVLFLIMSRNPDLQIPENFLRLSPLQWSEIYSMVQVLTVKAGLKNQPGIYLVESGIMNAGNFGTIVKPQLLITTGLLENLSERQIYGVLAHEISHIKNRDLEIFRLADNLRQLTQLMALTGFIMLLILFPAALAGTLMSSLQISASEILKVALFLMGAPVLSLLLQLGLSRVREFQADLKAAELTGDPRGLASALEKISNPARNMLEYFIFAKRGIENSDQPQWLRTHPDPEKRIRKLLQMEKN